MPKLMFQHFLLMFLISVPVGYFCISGILSLALPSASSLKTTGSVSPDTIAFKICHTAFSADIGNYTAQFNIAAF